MNSPDALPFLWVHGAWLWKAALLALLAVVALAWWALWRFWPRARPARPPLAEPFDEVSGVLVAARDAVVAPVKSLAVITNVQRFPDATYDLRPAKLFLQTDDDRRIELLGQLRVLAGSRAVVGRAGVPRALPRAELAELQRSAPWLHRWCFSRSDVREATLRTLQPGDRVIARGIIERGPAVGPTAAETDFRSAEVAWTMRGAEVAEAAENAEAAEPAEAGADRQRRPIELMAGRPAAERVRPAPIAVLAMLGMTLVAGYQIEYEMGERWDDECDELDMTQVTSRDGAEAVERLGPEPFPFDNAHPCIRATASPGHRHRAIRRVRDLLRDHPKPSEFLLRRQIAVDRSLGECEQAASRYADLGRYEEARAEARRCGSRRAEHLALVSLGRFAEAAALPVAATWTEPALPEVSTLIAAERWDEAARASDARAVELGPRPLELVEDDDDRLTARSYRCLAGMLRHFGGDEEALAELRELRSGRYGASCAPMLAFIEGPSAQNLSYDERLPHLSDTAFALDSMGMFAGLSPAERREPPSSPEELLVNLDASMGLPPWELWLAPQGDDVQALPPLPSYVLRWRAAHQVLFGDLEGARRTARAALARRMEPTEPLQPERDPACVIDRCDVLELGAAIDLFTPATRIELRPLPGGKDQRDKEWFGLWLSRFGRLLVRNGSSFAGTHFGGGDGDGDGGDELERMLAIAQGGDGLPLARHIMSGRRGGIAWWNDADLIAVLPRVRQGLDELRTQLLWAMPRSAHPSSLPHGAIRALARRTVMELAGLGPQAAAWNEIVQRYDRVLSDPKRLWALRLYELQPALSAGGSLGSPGSPPRRRRGG